MVTTIAYENIQKWTSRIRMSLTGVTFHLMTYEWSCGIKTFFKYYRNHFYVLIFYTITELRFQTFRLRQIVRSNNWKLVKVNFILQLLFCLQKSQVFGRSHSVDQLRLGPFLSIRVSMLRTIFCRCMSCTPIEVKVIVTIVTSNLISHIMILLAFVIITWLVDDFFVFFIRACCYVRKVALRTGDGKIIQCTFLYS